MATNNGLKNGAQLERHAYKWPDVSTTSKGIIMFKLKEKETEVVCCVMLKARQHDVTSHARFIICICQIKLCNAGITVIVEN